LNEVDYLQFVALFHNGVLVDVELDAGDDEEAVVQEEVLVELLDFR